MVLVKPEDYGGENPDPAFLKYRSKTPKQVLEFSDGVLEEYSTDEEQDEPDNSKTVVDASTLTWGPWMWYKAWLAGSTTLSFIDYIGEALASFLGITTSRYYFEMEEYKKRKANEDKLADQEKGWTDTNTSLVDVELRTVGDNRGSI